MSNPDAVPYVPTQDPAGIVPDVSGAPANPAPAEPPVNDPADTSAAAPASAQSLKRRAVRGSVWTIVGTGAAQVIRFFTNPILSRLLTPTDFGIVTIVSTFVTGLQALSDVGIEHAVIQSKRGDDRDFLDTAWTLHIVRGVIMWVLSCILAWPLSLIYDLPILLWLMPLAGLGPLLNGFNSTSMFTLSRHLSFGRTILLSLAVQLCGVISIITLAWYNAGPWAIVGGGLAGGVFMLVTSHTLLPGPRNRLRWDPAAARELVTFGKWILVSTFVTYWALQIDRPLLGYLRGEAVLGVYAIGLTLAFLPREVIGRLASVVLFPTLARSAELGLAQLGPRLLRARSLILAAGLASTVGVVLGAPTFFGVLYKPEYHWAAWFAQLASIGAWITLLQMSADRTFLAIGKPKVLVASNAANLIMTGLGAYVGLKLDDYFGGGGINGFMLGLAVGNFAGHAVIQVALAREGISVFRQDAVYTAVVLALAVGGCLAQRKAVDAFGHAVWVNAAVAALVCTPTCAWAGLRIWRGIKS